MSFVLEQSTSSFYSPINQSKENYLFTISSKKDRKQFSKFIGNNQFKVTEIKIKLTCFPKIENYLKYHTPISDKTFRSETRELVRDLNLDGHFVVAEVSLLK